MVLFNFPLMSGATKSQEHPRPPSVQEIISDLQSAKADDVAFKAPEGFLCLSREKETQGKTAGKRKIRQCSVNLTVLFILITSINR